MAQNFHAAGLVPPAGASNSAALYSYSGLHASPAAQNGLQPPPHYQGFLGIGAPGIGAPLGSHVAMHGFPGQPMAGGSGLPGAGIPAGLGAKAFGIEDEALLNFADGLVLLWLLYGPLCCPP